MAKNRDVELVIRAKNEASSTLKAVSQALKDLQSASTGAMIGAERSKSVITQLGASFAALTKASGGAAAMDALAKSAAKAGSQITALEKAISDQIAENARLASETTKTGNAITGLNTKSRILESRMKAQAAAAIAEQVMKTR